jgi:4-amino-4-deoxy-L-arabinose transferase-like glycosyltransferase
MEAISNRLGRRQLLVVGLLLILMVVMDVVSLRHKTPTYDEPGHFGYGQAVLGGRTDRLDDSKMPVSALNALGHRLLSPGQADSGGFATGALPFGRWVTILAAAALGAVVFCWSARVYGFEGGLLSLVIFLLAPNIHAHARLTTTDLYSALFTVLALYTLWLFTLQRRWWRAVVCGIALGAALLAKFSTVLLVPIFILVLAIRSTPSLLRIRRSRHGRELLETVGRGAGWLAAILLTSLVVLNAGYLFNGTGAAFGSYEFLSSDFQRLQRKLGPLSAVPLPVPRPYVEGLDMVRHNEVTGAARGPAYLFGKTQREPFPWYYAVTFLLKVPVATQILVLLAAAVAVRSRPRAELLRNELFFVLPALGFFTYFNFACSAQMGIRLAIMVLPLLHILCGALGSQIVERRAVRTFVALMVVYLAVSVGSYLPHLLSYHNELAGDRKTTYRLLADSNLDWGQNEWYAARYLERHPRTLKNPPDPVIGEILVSANLLTGVVSPGSSPWYEWLLHEMEPVDHVAYSYLVFRLTPAKLTGLNRFGSPGRRAVDNP